MPVTTSAILDFLSQHQTCSIERHETSSAIFSQLRRCLRLMIVSFRESDDPEAQAASDRLRTLLSEWLTVPVPFDDAMLHALEALGDASAIEMRWGRDIRAAYDEARQCARQLQGIHNPVRTKLVEIMSDLRTSGRSFKIFCHKRARIHFETLFDQIEQIPLDFLHSVREYRESEPFDILLKVGPLRSRGWGSAPDALLTAPRFGTLIQVVWSGCGDEPGFGYDPVSGPPPGDERLERPDEPRQARSGQINWQVHEIRSWDNAGSVGGVVPDMDELQVFAKLTQPQESRRALLLQTGDDHGILYAPYSRVLSFDLNSESDSAVDFRVPGDTLVEGMFVITPALNDDDLGSFQAEEGHYSRIWKTKLAAEFRRDPAELVKRLREAGISVVHLYSRIEHWCKPATTVIHAPQQMRDFELLVRVLGIDFDEANAKPHRAPWWQYAWDEIRRSRGEAIHTGFQDQQRTDEQLLGLLRERDAQIRALAVAQDSFRFPIPEESSLRGHCMFHKVMSIEDGFQAPGVSLRIVFDLDTIDQWRA